jgi:Na+/glutamate symporter
VLDPADPRIEWATFGRVVEDFIKSPVGEFLVKKAQEQSDKAVEKLKTVSPEDPTAIRAIQTDIQVAESIIQWLCEAIHEGQMALEHLKEDNDG